MTATYAVARAHTGEPGARWDENLAPCAPILAMVDVQPDRILIRSTALAFRFPKGTPKGDHVTHVSFQLPGGTTGGPTTDPPTIRPRRSCYLDVVL